MRDVLTNSGETEATFGRDDAINDIVGRTWVRMITGNRVDVDEITVEYPELMPELEHALRALIDEGEISDADAVIEQIVRQALAGEFEIQMAIGRGGQAIVLHAISRSDGQEYAIKVFRTGAGEGERSVKRRRQIQEAMIDQRLRGHPNILVPIEGGTGLAGMYPYVIIPYVGGVHIDEFAEARADDAHDVVRLFVQVLRAVGFAHNRNVVHRDIKPSNIIVDDDGVPYVLDFGMAAVVGLDVKYSRTGAIAGTLSHCSPEELDSLPATTRSDVYSLGLVLFQMITGRMPYRDGFGFKAISNAEVMTIGEAIARARPDSWVLPGSQDRGLQEVVAKSLGRYPHHRYPDADSFADDLEAWVNGRRTEARRERSGLRGILRNANIRRRWPLYIWLSVVFILTIGISFTVHRKSMTTLQQDVHERLTSTLSILDEDLFDRADGPAFAEKLLAVVNKQRAQFGEEGSISPDTRTLLWTLEGRIAMLRGDNQIAIRHFREAIHVDASNAADVRTAKANAMFFLGCLKRDMGLIEEAIGFARTIGTEQSKFLEASFHFKLGRMYFEREAYDLASLHAANAIQSAINMGYQAGARVLAEAQSLQGSALMRTGDQSGLDLLEDSVATRMRILETDPDNWHMRLSAMQGYAQLAREAKEKNLFHEARSHFQNAVNLGRYLNRILPEHRDIAMDLGSCLQQLGYLQLGPNPVEARTLWIEGTQILTSLSNKSWDWRTMVLAGDLATLGSMCERESAQASILFAEHALDMYREAYRLDPIDRIAERMAKAATNVSKRWPQESNSRFDKLADEIRSHLLQKGVTGVSRPDFIALRN